MTDTIPETAAFAVDPVTHNKTVAAAESAAKSKFPEPDAPVSDLVDLPGGLILHQDTEVLVKTAQVRELTGADEEQLARALASDNPFHIMNVLLECGVVKLGDEPLEDTPRLLKDLLIGDRDMLVLGIRAATYGRDIEVKNWPCPVCGELVDATFDIFDDVEVSKLEDPHDAEFDVSLRKKTVAHVRLATGHDQMALGEISKRPLAERNTRLLERCVSSFTGPDGRDHLMMAAPQMARQMGMADRRTILQALTERQPGPSYNGVKFKHDSCGNEVALAFDVGDMFLA